MLNVPLPEVLEVALVAVPPIEPAMVAVLLLHINWAGPALTVGAWFTVTSMVELTVVQGPVPSGSALVSVSVTVPEEMVGV